MINRALIRTKAVQIIYAYYQNGNQNIDAAERELFFSLSKAYDLYNLLLLLMVCVTRKASQRVEVEEKRQARLNLQDKPNRKFIENKFIAQLETNKMLTDFVEGQKKNWDNEEILIQTLLEQIQATDTYRNYMVSDLDCYEEDRELWRKLYKEVICNNETLDNVLEEQSLYWNDDKEVVDSFVMKTIRRFDPKRGAKMELLPEFKDEEDREFARRLLRTALLNGDSYRRIMDEYSHNWDLERLAYMDVIIMQIAIAEMFAFPNIPVSVTINEYVEMAKCYSTPKSGSYVNAMLDHIAKGLREEKRILK